MKLRLPLLLCLLAASLAVLAQQDDPRAAGEAALKDRDFKKATKLLADALAAAKSGQDEILYLLATAQQHDDRHDDAIATLDRLVKDHPASAWRMKALYKKGDVLAAKKEFALAAAVYDAQVAALTAPERRKRLALVYVGAGREFLAAKDPKDPTFVANYVAAHKLLTKSLELEALGADEEGVRADVIACELKGGMPRPQLLKSCDTFLEKFPKAARLDEALFAKATALRDVGRAWEAEKTWSRLATDLAASKLAPEGLWLAAQMHATGDLEGLRRLLPLLRRLAKDFGASEWAPKAEHQIGAAMSAFEDLRDDARRELMAFVDRRPKDERAPEALLTVAWLHRADGDDAKAVATYDDFLKRFPDSPRWPEVRQAIADVRWARLDRAVLRKDWPAARAAAQEFVDLHAADPRAATAAFRGADTLREEKKFREAVEAMLKVAARFAHHDEGHHARYAAAELLAGELDDFEAAFKEIPKVGGSWGPHAQQLSQKLQAKSIAIASERVFRGGEAASVKLTSRNVESVKFKLWVLDLKDYFEKKASMSALQSLEVSVIAPDAEWEHAIADFKRFKETKIDVPLPKKDPGAYVVTASAGQQEATTVVLVSDLAMIARAGRKGATVMVENLRTGEAVPGATVRTAADGKHLKTWTPETAASRLSFLVESGGHLAFRDLDVSSLPAPPERKPQAVILTDRRAYGPEDEVRVRLIVRDAADGAYAVPKDKKYRLAASSAQNVVFFEETLALSKHGTAGAGFRIPTGLSGGVVLNVYEAVKPLEKHVAQASVRIWPVAGRAPGFDFLYEDRTYFVGDDVDVTVVLRDAWSRPMPNRKVRVKTSADADFKDVMTGADGTFAVALRETAQFFRTGAVAIEVNHEGAADVQVIPLKPRGTFPSFDEASRVTEPVLSGDTKELVVVAKDGDDKPVADTFDWTVVRANEAGERIAVATGKVTTDKDGRGKLSFAAKDAGIHTVTVAKRDADNLPVRAQTAVQVFDDKDERKLRLRSTADAFEPGKAMEFTIVSRLDKGLAFVTLEGERVETVMPVTLEKGTTKITLNPPPATTRDFTVAVMMMQGKEFHADVRDFRVKAPEIKVEAKEVRPGDEAVVTVKAPPGSEVILAAAENMVIGFDVNVFNPARAGAYFAADSSAATQFAWATQTLDPRLVDALARLRQLEDSRGVQVMMEKELADLEGQQKPMDKPFKGKGAHDSIGAGGGGGGRYGGRLGGKRSSVSGRADPAPIAFLAAEADANGVATFRFRVPQGWGQYTVTAWAVDGGNAIATASAELKARAPVTVVFRAPESVVADEKTSAVALLTNHTAKEQEVTLTFGGDVKVKVPARSTVEHGFEWAGQTSFALDGVKQDVKVATRPKGPVAHLESGGAFTGRTELKPAGEGKFPRTVRYATGPAALLESLAEGKDDWTRASDASARLIALVARHRHAKTDATKRAVMEFAARRSAGLTDAIDDASWPVLVYLAAAEAKAAEFDIAPDGALLKQRFAQATHDDVKALILFALARGGEAQYGYVHRLWRAADTLSPRALACVALALKAAGKNDEAKAALERLAKAAKDDRWAAADVPVSDLSNTDFVATALAAFAFAEIDPANALLPKARAWLLSRTPATPFERAMLALAMQSTPDKSEVKELKIDGRTVTGFGEIAVDVASPVVEPTGTGTFYAVLRLQTPANPPAHVAVKRTAQWPALVVEGVTVPRTAVAVKEPVENPSMEKVAAGHAFAIEYELTVKGPTTRHAVVELPVETGFRSENLRVLLPPQAEAERKFVHRVWAYADLPGGPVLPAGADFRAGWQITHAERLGAGRIHFEKKQWRQAKDLLAPIFEKGTLVDAAAVEAARTLAYAGVELTDHPTVVRYFEILKEKSPAEVVPFDKIRGVGRAYAATGEHERAMQVHQGTCDAYFLQEANLSGALDELGRSREAVDQMKSLLLDHPDSQMNREMVFGLGQQLYSKGRAHRDPAEKDPKQLTRAELLAESAATLERYYAWFPTGAEGEQVALTLGSAYLEAARHAEAERLGKSAAARWPKSKFLDAYDYLVAVAEFAQRKYAESLAMCDRLETFDYGKHANPGPLVMRERALLMKAQIFHAKGELDKAIENYKKVKEQSPDAARSIAFLEREAIAVPDSTVAPLAKPVEIELEYAGVAEAHVRAYKVDLTMLALRRKGLADAASVEVAGFKPVFERVFKLDHPNAKRRERQKLALDLKDAGAYLVGVKAGDFFASGLVLRSNLSMTVQEETGGTVRVNVADSATGAFAEGVKATIFGTADQKIASGKTDLRGVWETHEVRGLAVVVAEKDGHVAMYRGQTALAVQPAPQRRAQDAAGQEEYQKALDDRLRGVNDAYEQNFLENRAKQQQGVEVERTKK